VTVPEIVADDGELNRAERAFVEAVLTCQGVGEQPTQSEFRRALEVMIDYAQQVQDNPPEGAPSQIVKRWLAPLSALDRVKIAAAAFVKFGATKPNIFQVRAAQTQLFGPARD
jgi:hypothetical protein